MKNLIWSFILLTTSLYSMEFSGFADTYLSSLSTQEGKIVTNYQRFRGKFSTDFDDSFLFASINGKLDNISGDKELTLHELYLDYSGEYFDIRLGKQLVVWGNADGLRITDLVCPSDLNELMAQEFDDIRKPLSLLKLKSDLDFLNLELIWIPVYEGNTYPHKSSPYYFKIPTSDSLMNANKPESKLENSEFAAKLSFYYSAVDFAISYLNTWADSPAFIISQMGIDPYYFRQNIIGLEISKPINEFVIRAESAIYLDNYFTGLKKESKNQSKAMIGIDYYPNSTFSLSTQYLNEKIWDYEKFIKEEENKNMFTLNTTLSLLRETLKISNMIYYSLDEEDLANNFSIDYALNDNFHILTGFNYFDASKKSPLFEKSQVWVKGKISF